MTSAFRESLKIGVPLAVAGAALAVAGRPWAWAGSGLLAACLGGTAYFFRDPERVIPSDTDLVVSAADGKVVGIEEMEEPYFQTGRRLRVAVFLSVFDVHVNRMPVGGVLRRSLYQAGRFLDVRDPEAPRQNEFQAWMIESDRGPVVVRAIAGMVARRIVPFAREGDRLERGARFGMIRFGSRTEVFLPPDCHVLVAVGDRVKGASTPIARWPTPKALA